jgi:hypothetical protein
MIPVPFTIYIYFMKFIICMLVFTLNIAEILLISRNHNAALRIAYFISI